MGIFTKTESWRGNSKYFFGGLLLAAFILGLVYVYFMNLTVLKIAESNANVKKLNEIKAESQNLEAIYINKLNELDISYARSLGFVEAEPLSYIYRQRTVVQGDTYGENYR